MRWVFYRDNKGLWHWKRKAPNGRVIEASLQGFDELEKCKADAREIGWSDHVHTVIHGGHLQGEDS